VAAEHALLQQLGVTSVVAVIGGSMGGMRALEWLIGYPDRVAAGLVLATGAAATADQIGLQTAQLHAVRQDPDWAGGDYHGTGRRPDAGLGLARRIAHLSYRTADELEARFGRESQHTEDALRDGRFQVQSYLDHHATKLVRRFDAGSYVVLTEAMNRHDVGRGRGGVAAALASVRAPVVVAGIDTDRLYPLQLQRELAAGLPNADELAVISSPVGHDGFLIEVDAVAALVRRTLALGGEAPSAAVDGDQRGVQLGAR
jgi:homoserine O-acetyltransferase